MFPEAERPSPMDVHEVYGALVQVHHSLLEDSRNEPEGLDRAACSPDIKHLAQLAAGASAQGLTAERWRSWIIDDIGPEAAPVLRTAEACMRENGLWPWNGRVTGSSGDTRCP